MSTPETETAGPDAARRARAPHASDCDRGTENAASMLPRIKLDCINVHLTQRHVLHDVSWSLEPGQHWAIVGSNGSGKSTLLRVIAGSQWIDEDGGTRAYSPDGSSRDAVTRAATWIRLVSAEQHERYARLDLPFSGREVVESGFENSVYVQRAPAGAQAERVDALLDEFGLQAIATRPIRELSSGQIRRLLIARALVGEPRVLVLDEYTNGLDRVSRHDVLVFLDRLAAQVALVVASHRVDDFPGAITHTATIREGRIVGSGVGRPAHGRPAQARLARRRPGRVQAGSERPLEPDIPGARQPDDGSTVLVRIRHADVYRGRELVLKNVDWQIRRGEHTAIKGANGAGKTTFAGLVAGTIPAATGADIVRFGQTGPFDIWKLKERIAHVSDDLQIAYDRGETVGAVVASGFPSSIGLFMDPTRGQRAAVAGVLDRIGLGHLAERTFTQLSFGERRKVLIARSLVRAPDIFILDEVWNGLDSAFRHALRGLLGDMAQAGTTIVAIAHDESDDILALTRRVCTIENGEIRLEPQAVRPPAGTQGNALAPTAGSGYD